MTAAPTSSPGPGWHRQPAIAITAVVAWMGLIFAMSARSTVPPAPGLGPELTSIMGHFGVYFVLAILLWWALGTLGLETRRRIAIALALAVAYGISDEWHQSFVPGRQPDILDVLTDAIGAAAGIAVAEWASQRWQRRVNRSASPHHSERGTAYQPD